MLSSATTAKPEAPSEQLPADTRAIRSTHAASRGPEPAARSPRGDLAVDLPNLRCIETDNPIRIRNFTEGLFYQEEWEVNKLGPFRHFPFCEDRESGSARRDGVFTCQVTHLRSY